MTDKAGNMAYQDRSQRDQVPAQRGAQRVDRDDRSTHWLLRSRGLHVDQVSNDCGETERLEEPNEDQIWKIQVHRPRLHLLLLHLLALVADGSGTGASMSTSLWRRIRRPAASWTWTHVPKAKICDKNLSNLIEFELIFIVKFIAVHKLRAFHHKKIDK